MYRHKLNILNSGINTENVDTMKYVNGITLTYMLLNFAYKTQKANLFTTTFHSKVKKHFGPLSINIVTYFMMTSYK